MKVLVSLLCVLGAEAGIDENSLLQNKKDHHNRELGPLLDRAAAELVALSNADVQDVVDDFSKQLKTTSMSVLQMPQTEQDALLQRASQGKEFSSFVKSYNSLPVEVQDSVDTAVLNSPAMNQVYDSLQPVDKQALLLQLDRSTTGKNCRDVVKSVHGRTFEARECTSTSTNGRGGHSHTHWHGDQGSGTETVTRNKDGELVHRHTHRYSHNGQGGDANTDTTTQGKGSYAHGHSHSHAITNGRTSTQTATSSSTHDGEHTHSHTHSHTHKSGENTRTNTGTVSTYEGEVIHSHGHEHQHGEDDDYETRSVTDTNHGDRIVTTR